MAAETKEFEYKATSCSGNFFDSARYVNDVWAKEGWRIVAVSTSGYNTIIMLERPKPDFPRFPDHQF